jgi:hypothetical protein
MSEILTHVAIYAGGAGAIFFAASYMTFFNWRKTEAGKALMGFVTALVALFLLGSVGVIWGEYEFKHDLRLLVYTAVAFTMWRLVWVLWRNWRRGDERPLSLEVRGEPITGEIPAQKSGNDN